MSVLRASILLLALAAILSSVSGQEGNQLPVDGLTYLSDFNVLVKDDFVSQSSSCEGRIAAGADVQIMYYQACTAIEKDCNQIGVIANNELRVQDAGVNNQMAAYGVSEQTQNANFECSLIQQSGLLDFSTIFSELYNTSLAYEAVLANGIVEYTETVLFLRGSDPSVNIFYVANSTLENSAEVNIDVPEDSWTFINVAGVSNTFSNLQVILYSTVNINKVLWNFFETQTLRLDAVQVKGSINAPLADVSFDDGNIEGSLASVSFNGTGNLLNYPYHPPLCICPPCPSNFTLPQYGVFVQNNIVMSGSDCQGQIAAGGDVDLSNYSVGTGLSDSKGKRTDLAVGFNLFFESGSVPNGNIVAQGKAEVINVAQCGNCTVQQDTSIGIDFSQEFLTLVENSAYLGTIAPTGTIETLYEEVTLVGHNQLINFFTVTDDQLSAATSFNISIPESSWAIINIDGTTNSISNLHMNLDHIEPNRIIFNLYETTELTLSSVSVQGSVVAGLANVDFVNGDLNGSLYAKSLTGSGAFANVLPLPIPPPCPPCQCEDYYYYWH